MNLLDYFSPIDIKQFDNNKFEEGFLGKNIQHQANFDTHNCQIVLIGLNENRNNFLGNFEFNTLNIRKILYSLRKIDKLKITDLGNIHFGKKIADTYAALTQLIEFFAEKNIIPIIFGGTQEIAEPITKQLVKSYPNQPIEISFIDALFDYTNEKDFHSKTYLNHPTFLKKNTIKSIIGYQTYFNSSQIEQQMKNQGFNFYRLGNLRNNIQAIEPILRDTDFLSFDLASIRQSDSPQNLFKSPNGLYAEEACQLAYLSGISDKIKCFTIGEINTSENQPNASEHLMAQIIWHFLEGLSLRQKDYPIQEINNYKKIYVQNEKIKQELIFYQNEKNNRFWLQLSAENNKEPLEIIACSEADYRAICLNEIPQRIWKRISDSL